MAGKTALIVGATGLVGRELLNTLLSKDHYAKILIVGRRSIEIKDNRIEELIVNFDELEKYQSQISAHDYYCCLGTTMAQAKSKEAFYRVDFTYPMELAKIAQADPQFETFNLVSAYGANAQSGLFYNSVKGQLEEALKEMGLPALHIYQPSLLLGYRPHFRIWEEMAKLASSIFSFFIIGSRLRFWAIKGSQVAEAMFYVASSDEKGIHIHKPLEMQRIARKKEYTFDSSRSKVA
ncbi:NAD-dependent epimerase/dehydratase family protein [Reichenbachiella agarivorans]|uniref:NAD-dependent epimerase/dehydratase family protein n=1 Tax=Reichenbachiella agarivorans TaxID=2979464 RepID=A0ABY6CSK7_9BACT|nr:NAD-dependent epimerase/dehydratase family protein [Reichenbachiella agarivorans]UXP33501.1 NAD-dependent epimerase/dehydratase family protein [Reichenbachiella agarivorans]